jgi:hypothetical protein
MQTPTPSFQFMSEIDLHMPEEAIVLKYMLAALFAFFFLLVAARLLDLLVRDMLDRLRGRRILAIRISGDGVVAYREKGEAEVFGWEELEWIDGAGRLLFRRHGYRPLNFLPADRARWLMLCTLIRRTKQLIPSRSSLVLNLILVACACMFASAYLINVLHLTPKLYPEARMPACDAGVVAICNTAALAYATLLIRRWRNLKRQSLRRRKRSPLVLLA